MKVLNIAYFLSVSSDFLGGADNTLFMQALLMSSCHHVVVVLPCDEKGKSNMKFQKKCETFNLEYEIFSYDAATTIQSMNLANYKRDIDRIGCFVRKKKIDILHSVQINPVVEAVSREYGIPHVMNIYGLMDWEWKVPFPDIFPQYVSCDSEFCLKKWMAYLNCKGKCIRVYDDISIKKQETGNKLSVVIGAAGTICEYKNQLEVIKAVEFVIKSGRKVQLILAGEDCLPYAASCKDYIERHGLKDSIQLLGFVDDMKDFFEKIDVFICGSRLESFPASVVEAISCNIPVISTPVAGIPEILENRKNAYLSRGYSAKELQEIIEVFLDDYETGRLDSILAEENETYEKYFTAEVVKKQLEGLYDDMLKNTAMVKDLQSMADYEVIITQLIKGMKKEGLGDDDIQLTYSRLLYLHQIKDKFSGKRCYIWGAGRWGKITRTILKCLNENIQIIAFVDKNRTEPLDGIRVIKKEEIDMQDDIVVLISFVNGQKEAVTYLHNKNMEVMENVFIIA